MGKSYTGRLYLFFTLTQVGQALFSLGVSKVVRVVHKMVNLSSKALKPSFSWLNFKPSGQTRSMVVPTMGVNSSSRFDADQISEEIIGFKVDNFLHFSGAAILNE